MTRQARFRLNKELATLRRRPGVEVPDDYMDTDENREDYRARRSRIGAIETLLTDAIVEDNPADEGIAAPDTAVTVYYDDSGDIDTFVLGGHGAGDDDNKIYPLRSSIGRAVAGARPGEHRTYTLPGTAPIAITVLKVEPAVPSTMNKHPAPASAHSGQRRPKPPGITAAGLRESLSEPSSATQTWSNTNSSKHSGGPASVEHRRSPRERVRHVRSTTTQLTTRHTPMKGTGDTSWS